MNIKHQNDKLLIGAVAIIAALVGSDVACNTPPASTPVDVGNLVSCVEGQLQSGDTNVADIAMHCGGAELSVVEDIIASLLAAQGAPPFAIKAVTDGGAPMVNHPAKESH